MFNKILMFPFININCDFNVLKSFIYFGINFGPVGICFTVSGFKIEL